MDMINLEHAKKAQALASDLDYRKKLHEYTVVPEDLKTQWAKKAYGLQSEVGTKVLISLSMLTVCSQGRCWIVIYPEATCRSFRVS